MTSSFTPRDPDYASRVRASFDAQRVMATVGATLVEIGPGRVVIELDHRDELTQQDGYLHAGIISAVLDSACGYAAFSLMPAEAAVLTVEYKVNLLRPANAARYTVAGHVVKVGRTLTVCQATAAPADGGQPIALMTGTMIALGPE
jgi:uncharacterized protein (TIGR00369 family)